MVTGHLVTPHILRESLCRSLSAQVTASILRESLQNESQVTLDPIALKSRSRSQTPRVTVHKTKHTNQHKQSQVSTKTTKCQPAVRDTLVTVPHTPRVTVGVPDSWLARLKTNYLSNVTLVYQAHKVVHSQSGHTTHTPRVTV